MRRAKAFTLIELLIVIAIIALLVAMVAPMLGRARDLAKRAVCSANMHNLGTILQAYAAEHKSYPHMSPWVWRSSPMMMWDDGSFSHELDGWPKIYGLLEFNGFKGTRKTAWGNWYYGGPINQIWPGAMCPSMDVPLVYEISNNAGNNGFWANTMYWIQYHPWAMSYQWNPMMRAKTKQSPFRYVLRLHPLDREREPDMWQWPQPVAFLPPPRDDTTWVSHAISPAELESPVRTAEAWDTWDPECLPNLNADAPGGQRGWWGNTTWHGSQFVPGWQAGMTRAGATGLLNGHRHRGSPNILYADGGVRADATKRVDPLSAGFWVPSGAVEADYVGAVANTWPDWNETYGTYHHLVPTTRFEGGH